MEYDYAKMTVDSVIVIILSLILGFLFAFLNIGEYSFIFALLIGGAIVGLMEKNIDSALIVGGVAGLVVSILQGIIAPVILAATTAELFPILGAFLLCIVAGAFGCGVVALVKDIRN